MSMRRSLGLVILATCVLPGQVMAAPITISQSAFSGTEQIIGFETVLQNEEVTTQFSALGVVFSGGLYGERTPTNVDDFSSPGAVIAGNFTGNGQVAFGQIEATFSSSVTRVGFFGVSLGTMTIEAFRGATSLGVFVFPTDDNPPDVFMGLQDFAGIDRIVVNSPSYPYFEVDDVRFETVPEPGVFSLLTLGLASLGAAPLRAAIRTRRSRRVES